MWVGFNSVYPCYRLYHFTYLKYLLLHLRLYVTYLNYSPLKNWSKYVFLLSFYVSFFSKHKKYRKTRSKSWGSAKIKTQQFRIPSLSPPIKPSSSMHFPKPKTTSISISFADVSIFYIFKKKKLITTFSLSYCICGEDEEKQTNT